MKKNMPPEQDKKDTSLFIKIKDFFPSDKAVEEYYQNWNRTGGGMKL